MTMALSSDNGFDTFYWPESQISHQPSAGPASLPRAAVLPLIDAKLQLPKANKGVTRTKLLGLLERSALGHAGTLLVGRAGSGKTMLAAAFARKASGAGWYSIDAGDGDWAVFSRYFRAMILGKEPDEPDGTRPPEARTPPEIFADLSARLEARSREWPGLIVLDGVDHLFDSKWFAEFFSMMMASLPPHAHVLVLSRTSPPTPLWRLRSKQVVNVVDEKLLAFSLSETEKLFANHGRRSRREAAAAHRECYGRPGNLVQLLESSGLKK